MKTLHQSPTEDDFVQNPYRCYAEVLADEPIRYWEDYGMPVVFDHATVDRLLRDRRLGRALPDGQQPDFPAHLAAFGRLERVSMLDLEPPAHTRLRGLVLRAFTSRRIAGLAPEIRDTCDALIDTFPSGDFDLLPAYCTALPVRIIARLLGVPESMSGDLLRWSNTMVAMYQAGRTPEIEITANKAAAEFYDFLSDYIDLRRKTPRDDLLSELISAEAEGDRLNRDEMIGTCVLLLNAGHEATVHTLGNAVKALLERGRPAEDLKDAHISATVEEVLRYDPPLHMFTRYAYQDIALGSHTLPAGQLVGLSLGAAGRDPKRWDQPNLFEPRRPPQKHTAFGGGLHFCVGAPLARLELEIGLQRLFSSCPDLKLSEPPRYRNSYHFHGLETLVVRT